MLGLKNEEYSPKMFFLLTRKLYLKLTKFLAILLLEFVSKGIVTKRLCIESTGFIETNFSPQMHHNLVLEENPGNFLLVCNVLSLLRPTDLPI